MTSIKPTRPKHNRQRTTTHRGSFFVSFFTTLKYLIKNKTLVVGDVYSNPCVCRPVNKAARKAMSSPCPICNSERGKR